MPTDIRKENLNLYACIIRKYYIGEEDYIYAILNKISKSERISAWNYALKKIQHNEKIKNSTSISTVEFSIVLKRYDGFDNHDQIVRYLFSDFEPSNLKLTEENIERRLRYLLAIKTLKYLEKNINSEYLQSEFEKNCKKAEGNLRKTFEYEYRNLKNIESLKREKMKRTEINVAIILILFISILGYFIFKHLNNLEKFNSKILHNAQLQKNHFEHKIDSINKEMNFLLDENSRLNNLLKNEDFLSEALNENKFKSLKQNGFSGNISFEGIFGYKSIRGYLNKGEERGVWVYEKYNGEKEVYEWISKRVGAICRDGNRSYATGRGACSHHGGVDYWLNEYQRVKVSD